MAVRADAVAPACTPTPATGLVGYDDGDTFRDRRRSRLAEGRRRRELLSAADPSVDPQFINAIAAADRFWGPDEQWRDALRSQRSAASTASAEPSAGTVDASEVSPAHPALVTIARLRSPTFPGQGISDFLRRAAFFEPFTLNLIGRHISQGRVKPDLVIS